MVYHLTPFLHRFLFCRLLNKLRLFNHVILYMGHLLLVLPALNLSILLDAGILILVH